MKTISDSYSFLCRLISYKQIPEATLTFKLSTCPIIGIEKISSHNSLVRRLIPLPLATTTCELLLELLLLIGIFSFTARSMMPRTSIGHGIGGLSSD